MSSLSAHAAVRITTAATSTTIAAIPRGGPGILTGAGSTFVAPFFAPAFAKYHQQHPAVTVNYAALGSSAGIAAISAQQVDFGASDVPMNASELAAAKGGPITQVPDALAGVGVAYNPDLPAGTRLQLTGPVIARIFLGQITRWNDPAITALNPGIGLPDESIAVVHRSDGSGTTYIFSNYLSSVDPTWAAKVGTGKTLNWPVGEGAEGNASVATTVYRTPFSIGYIEQAYSQGLILPFAAIRNQIGNYLLPSTLTITAAAAQKPHITPTDFSIVNQPGANSYPISGYSWAMIYTHQPDQSQRAGTGQHARLAHPQRPGLRRRQPIRTPATPGPATRPHHAPADHRPERATPAGLTRDAARYRTAPWQRTGMTGGLAAPSWRRVRVIGEASGPQRRSVGFRRRWRPGGWRAAPGPASTRPICRGGRRGPGRPRRGS